MFAILVHMTHSHTKGIITLTVAVACIVSGIVAAPAPTHAAFGDTSTYVSKIYYGDGKPAAKALFDFPQDVEVNAKGAFIIADTYNNVIRKIKANGKVKTLAGRGSYGNVIGGVKTAEFANPKGVDVGGHAVYVADTGNNAIKKIQYGVVTTLVATGLNAPEDVALYGTTLYILDTGNNALKKVSINGGAMTTITTNLSTPVKMDVSSDGSYAYVANSGSHQVKRVNLSSGVVNNTAGTGDAGAEDGSCANATFDDALGVHVHSDTLLYVSDGNGFDDSVRKIDLTGCTVETIAADSTMTSINVPRGLTTHNGSLYVLSSGISIIQRYTVSDPSVNTRFAGANRFNVKDDHPVLVGNPKFLMLSRNKKKIYFSENNRIREVSRKNPTTSRVIAGSVVDNYAKKDDRSYVGESARFSDVSSFAVSLDGTTLYVVDRNNNRIREVVIATGETSYLTGAGQKNMSSGSNGFADGEACPNQFAEGVEGCAYFTRPTGSALSKDGNYLYVTDASNNRVRRVTVTGPDKGRVTTIAGSGEEGFDNGVGTAATFHAPMGLAISHDGSYLVVADRDNHALRKIVLATNTVSTLVGTGTNGYLDARLSSAVLSYPESLRIRKNGDIYFSEPGSSRIRMIDASSGVTKLVAGSGERGFKNGARLEARFNNPKGLLILKRKLLVAELYNDLIRSIDITGEAPFAESAPTVSNVNPSEIAKEWFSGATASVQVIGSGFRNGAVSYAGSHRAVHTYVQSSTSVVMEMPISEMQAGHYTVRVMNSDGQYADVVNGLDVSENGQIPGMFFVPE